MEWHWRSELGPHKILALTSYRLIENGSHGKCQCSFGNVGFEGQLLGSPKDVKVRHPKMNHCLEGTLYINDQFHNLTLSLRENDNKKRIDRHRKPSYRTLSSSCKSTSTIPCILNDLMLNIYIYTSCGVIWINVLAWALPLYCSF
jgi:hypothetical protein